MRKRIALSLSAALLLTPPATATGPVNLLAPEPEPEPEAAPAALPDCSGAAAERSALRAERTAINETIGDIALGRSRKRRKLSGGQVAAGVAGTAASVLLPFGLGALLGAGAQAAAKSGRKRKTPPPEPDVPAMIDRLRAVDARLAELEGCA